jgi:hypothetical protein
MKRIITTVLLAVATVSINAADSQFFQLSLTPDIALHSKDTKINGITLAVWSENPQSAFAWGFVNGSSGDSSGFSMGLANYSENYTGVQFGFVNLSKGTFVGWQNGMVNIGKEVRGLQWGTVNYAESLYGVQIGFANIVKDNPWFKEFPNKLAKGMVFVNWSF